ncbi:MAG: hypothetical protein M3R02_24100 [Chloroflexota bacterium]|nr:hypothetical protein [Chloroflexota bacterium]
MAEDRKPAPDGSDRDPAVRLDPKAKRTIGVLEAVFLGLLGLRLVALIALALISAAQG